MKIDYILILSLLTFSIGCDINPFGPNSGEIKGIVRNNLGEPLVGVKVNSNSLENDEGMSSSSFDVTDDHGNYILSSVPLGHNEVTVEKNGYKTVMEHIEVGQEPSVIEFDFNLMGNPEFNSLHILNPILYLDSISSNGMAMDDLELNVVVQDTYPVDNNQNAAELLLLIKNETAEVKEITSIRSTSSGGGYFIFKDKISFSDFGAGQYSIDFQVIDPDGLKSDVFNREVEVRQK